MVLAPLPVVIPLLAAAALIAVGSHLPRRVLDIVSALTAATVLGICITLMLHSGDKPIVYWFGGWQPYHHFPIGICFAIDPIGAGLAALVSLLVLAAFTFSWQYFESIKALYHAVMLVFLAAMCGLCLTGDLFNLFVWFELMSAAGVTLCGYKAEESGPLQGALNFAVTNTIGAFLSLTGVALVYAQTGALNFAQVGASLAQQNVSGPFISIAFLFIIAGFLVKAAAFPFHFWLADAHAVAPTPVCILFSGIMVELGLYAAARVYWSIFATLLVPPSSAVRGLFLVVGTLTALIGAIECFGQRHLKRLLAFSTISHMGLMILGFGLFEPDALAGSALYVVGHGMVKASLFICAGILLHRFSSVDEFDLKGRGRRLPYTGILMVIGALGLAGLPPFTNYFGEGLIDEAARKIDHPWISIVFMISGILTAGAVLRLAGRIFLGWGESRDQDTDDAPHIPMEAETDQQHRKTPATMFIPAVLLLAIGLSLGPIAHFRDSARHAAHRMEDTRQYAAYVLGRPATSVEQALSPEHPYASAWRSGITAGAAALLSLLVLFHRSVAGRFSRPLAQAARSIMRPLRELQTGRVGDYIAWFVMGIAAYGAFLLLWRQ